MRDLDIRQLVAWLEAAGLSTFELEGPEVRLRLVLGQPGSRPGAASIAVSRHDLGDAVAGCVAVAQVAGVLRLQHAVDDAPFAELGDEVAAGRVIALLQIGTIYAPVVAPVSGVLVRLLALPGRLVGFGAPLFEIVGVEAKPEPAGPA